MWVRPPGDATPRARVRTWSRGVTSLLAVGVLGALGVTAGWAASLTTAPTFLAAGSAVTSTCDPAPAWTYAFGKNEQGQVATVVVANVAVGCAGGGLAVTLGDGSGVPAFGSTATLTCSTTCSATVPLTSGLRYPSGITTVQGVVTGP